MLRRARGRRPGLLWVPPALFRLALTVLGHGYLWERIGDELVVDTGKLEALGWRPVVATYDGLAAMLQGAGDGGPAPRLHRAKPTAKQIEGRGELRDILEWFSGRRVPGPGHVPAK